MESNNGIPNGSTVASSVNKAADLVKGGIRDAQQGAHDVAAGEGANIDALSNSARKLVDTAGAQAKQGMKSVHEAATKAADSTSKASQSLITYTKENPVKALLLAAASGALIWGVLKAFAPDRDR
jgi:F0F1-type ATP synthase membrane subunit b/b'